MNLIWLVKGRAQLFRGRGWNADDLPFCDLSPPWTPQSKHHHMFLRPYPPEVRWITSSNCVYVMICTCQWHVNTTMVFCKMKTSLSYLIYPVYTLTMNCRDYIHWPLCLHIHCMQNTLIQQSPSVLMKYLNDIHFVLSEQQILCNLYALCHNSIVVLWRYCVDVII